MESLEDFLTKGSRNLLVVPGYADVFPNVRVGGVTVPATWAGVRAQEGDPLILGQLSRKDAPAEYIVFGVSGDGGPREGTVSAAPAGSATITVTASGKAILATFLSSYAPTVGDLVRLHWSHGLPTVLGKVGSTPAPAPPPPATPPPPPPATTGVLGVAAIDSATYSVGYGWNSYYGQNVYQGNGSTWGAPSDNRGSWFYGNGAGQLAGATIDQIEFRVPKRLGGGVNADQYAHLYLHTSSVRPGGDVGRTAGPSDVLVVYGYQGGNYITLPVGWASQLIAGGGISMTGSPYMGLQGKGGDAASGHLKYYWRR